MLIFVLHLFKFWFWHQNVAVIVRIEIYAEIVSLIMLDSIFFFLSKDIVINITKIVSQVCWKYTVGEHTINQANYMNLLNKKKNI